MSETFGEGHGVRRADAKRRWVRLIAITSMLTVVPSLQGCLLSATAVAVRYAAATAPSQETYTVDRKPSVVLSEAQSLVMDTAIPDASPDVPADALRWKNKTGRYQFLLVAKDGDKDGQTRMVIDAKLIEDWNNRSDTTRDHSRAFVAELAQRLGTTPERIIPR